MFLGHFYLGISCSVCCGDSTYVYAGTEATVHNFYLKNAFITSVSKFCKIFQYNILTHFMPLISLYTPWKYQKTSGILMFSEIIKRDQWHGMDQQKTSGLLRMLLLNLFLFYLAVFCQYMLKFRGHTFVCKSQNYWSENVL